MYIFTQSSLAIRTAKSVSVGKKISLSSLEKIERHEFIDIYKTSLFLQFKTASYVITFWHTPKKLLFLFVRYEISQILT